MVDDYKDSNVNIMNMCVKISELLVVKIPASYIYEELVFQDEQVDFSCKLVFVFVSSIGSQFCSPVNKITKEDII